MGWGVTDYPSAPLETTSTAGVDCQAKACGVALTKGEMWQCADCHDDFCESHIVDLLDNDAELLKAHETGSSVFVCEPCRARRMRTSECQSATAAHHRRSA